MLGGTWAEFGTMADWDPFVNFVTTNDMTDQPIMPMLQTT